MSPLYLSDQPHSSTLFRVCLLSLKFFFLTISNSSLPCHSFLLFLFIPSCLIFKHPLPLFDSLPHFFLPRSWIFFLDHQVFIYVDNCRLTTGVRATLILRPLCRASSPATPRFRINLLPSPLPQLLSFTGREVWVWHTNEYNISAVCINMWTPVPSPELFHFIHLTSSHHLLPTQVSPSNSRVLRNSPLTSHCTNQMQALQSKPTGITVPARRAPRLPPTSTTQAKVRTSVGIYLQRTARRRKRRGRRDAILK